MTHETRQGIRIVITLLHMLVQLLIIWIIVGILNNKIGKTPEDILIIIKRILAHMSIMLGSYYLYGSLIRLFTGPNKSRHSSQ